MIWDGIQEGFVLLFSFDPEVWGPIRVSVTVALTSTVIASILALPFGLFVGLGRFRGRRVVVGLLN